jgi:hypothetical protein
MTSEETSREQISQTADFIDLHGDGSAADQLRR